MKKSKILKKGKTKIQRKANFAVLNQINATKDTMNFVGKTYRHRVITSEIVA